MGCAASVRGGAAPDASASETGADRGPIDTEPPRPDAADATPGTDAPLATDVPPPGDLRLDDGRGCVLTGSARSALCEAPGDACAVRFDAALRCLEGADGLSVAAGPGSLGYLSFGFTTGGRHHRLYTLDPAGTSRVAIGPLGTEIERVATTPGGVPWLFGAAWGLTSVGPGIFAGVPAGAGGWSREAVQEGRSLVLDDAAFTAEDAPAVLYHRDGGPLTLARRDAGGGWSSRPVTAEALGPGQLAPGRPGEDPAVVYWARGGAAGFELRVRTPAAGMGLRVAATRATDVLVQHLAAVIPRGRAAGAGLPVVSVVLDGALRVFVPAEGTWRELVAPVAPALPPGDCPTEPFPPERCEPALTCVERGTERISAGLVGTGDGGVWLVTLWRDVDRTLRLSYRCGVGMPCICDRATTEDRTTHRFFLVRVPLEGDALPAPALALTLERGVAYAGGELRATAQGRRVVVAWRFTPPLVPGGATAGIRYLDIDTARLR